MFKKIILILSLIFMIVLPVFGQTGAYTSHNLFYLPDYGAGGITEYNTYNQYMEIADAQIWTNRLSFGNYYLKTEIDTLPKIETIYSKDIIDSDELAAALGAYYLKTDINTQGKMETIWGVTLATDSELHTQNTDTDLDSTFEATFVKKVDTVNVLSDITSAGADIEDAVTKKHTQNTDTAAGGEWNFGAYSAGFTLQSTTGDGTTTIDWRLGNKFKFTFGAQNETFTFTAPTNPCTLMLTLIQDATGSRTVTWPATVKWPGGVAPTLTTTGNARDKVALDWDGTQYDGMCSKDFK